MNKGTWYAISAFTIFGFFPIYWKQLGSVPAIQILGHRIVWSFLLLIILILITSKRKVLKAALKQPVVLARYAAAAVLLGANWGIYVWAVSAGFVIETSLAYFINPLLSVALGVLFLRERLRPAQWAAIGMAVAGVLYLTFLYGEPPWIALILASTFAVYGLLKKTSPLGSVDGLALETGILFLPAAGLLLFSDLNGAGAFLHSGAMANILMIGAGPVTVLPLLLFSAAAQRIPLSLVGILQYITPTMFFFLGVFVYNEPFSLGRLVGFIFVWIGLILIAADSVIWSRNNHRHPAGS
ncbi:MAG: EamA family transporter RarD [Anaerolineales bacterium]|nr:EamA family transporter RarD [Anaerolineales bacterium]